MTARNTKDYLAEIRDLTTDPPDARVAIELIEQVLNRWEDAEADAALEQLARTGALDDLPILDKGTSDPARVQSEDVSPTIGSATNSLGRPDASAPTGSERRHAEWFVCFRCWLAFYVPTTGYYGDCQTCGKPTVPWYADPQQTLSLCGWRRPASTNKKD